MNIDALNEAKLRPVHVVAGLRVASRDFLATYIAVLEDKMLRQRLEAHFEPSLWAGVIETCDSVEGDFFLDDESIVATVRSMLSRTVHWRDSTQSDDELRIVLWKYICQVCRLPAFKCTSLYSESLCDDVVAALLHELRPSALYRIKTRLGIKTMGGPIDFDLVSRAVLIALLPSLPNESVQAGVEQGTSDHSASAAALSLLVSTLSNPAVFSITTRGATWSLWESARRVDTAIGIAITSLLAANGARAVSDASQLWPPQALAGLKSFDQSEATAWKAKD